MHEEDPQPSATIGAPEEGHSRRSFVLASLGLLLAGCATNESLTTLPSPAWDAYEPARQPPTRTPTSTPRQPRGVGGAIARSQWAGGTPVTSQMNRMAPVRYITIHHDGMQPFLATDQRSAALRIESIRRSHRSRGWADIGYHFAVDPAGRVWAARPLGYQGAHVKDHNPANIGVVALGNFDRQSPTNAQVIGLTTFVAKLRGSYGVSASQIKTHQEWAATACPGQSMQRYVASARSNGRFG